MKIRMWRGLAIIEGADLKQMVFCEGTEVVRLV